MVLSQVACGASHTVFVLSNGSALACGANFMGQLGLGHTSGKDEVCTYIVHDS